MGLGELLLKADLPIGELAQAIQGVPARTFADALSASWSRMSAERRADAVQWIETLPLHDSYSIRCHLMPAISKEDPRSARMILPAKPKALDSGEARERFARTWLGNNADVLDNLLTGELLEYEVTRVLRVFLKLAQERPVPQSVRARVLRAAAKGISSHKLTETKSGIEPVFQVFIELLGALPPPEGSHFRDWLSTQTPEVASRLGLKKGPRASEDAAESLPPLRPVQSTPTVIASTGGPKTTEEVLPSMQASSPAVPTHRDVASGEQVRPPHAVAGRPRAQPRPHPVEDLESALLATAGEYLLAADLLQRAASEIKNATGSIRELGERLEHKTELQETLDKELKAASLNIESLRGDLTQKDRALMARNEKIAEIEAQQKDLATRVETLQEKLGTAIQQLDEQKAQFQFQLEALRSGMAGTADQKLHEFRQDIGRRVSDVLRGTPHLSSAANVSDGRAILIRLWELVDVLSHKAIPIRTE